MKLAREATGRPMILGFLGQYHGETTYLTAAGSTDLSEVTSNSAQYVSGLVFAPYPNSFRAPFHKGPGPYDDTIYVDYLEEVLLRHQVDPEQIAGVLIEPVLGEGGIVIPSAEFWERLTGLCKRYGWALIADEVQTGIGRCGTMFAVERWDLEPDLLLLGKGFAGGVMPIGGDARHRGDDARRDQCTSAAPSPGRPPPARAALTNIENIIRDGVLDNVQEMERVALEVLGPLVDRFEQVGDVRAAGALIGVEFVTDMETIAPAPAFQLAVHHAALRRGVLGITQEGKWVYRLQPALNQPIELFRWSCEQVADAIERGQRQPAGRTRLAPAADWDLLVGYADRLSARPGERLRVMVSSAAEFASTVVRLPGREPAGIDSDRIGPARLQPVRTGSAVEVPHDRGPAPDRRDHGQHLGLARARDAQGGARRALLASWGEDGADGWALVLDADGRPCFEVGAGGRREQAVAERAARPRIPGPGSRPARSRRRDDRGRDLRRRAR